MILESQSFELEESQRETLFHIRCKFFENICYLILDSEL